MYEEAVRTRGNISSPQSMQQLITQNQATLHNCAAVFIAKFGNFL
jgi:hypothetical protein